MIKLRIGPNFIKMINFYLSDFKYNPNYRSYLVDILKPLYPINNLEKYSLDKMPTFLKYWAQQNLHRLM